MLQLFSLVVMLLAAMPAVSCSSRYSGWQYVRIEFEVPREECEYIVQEVCPSERGDCFNWYKQRATIYDADTVVVTSHESSPRVEVGPYGGAAYEATTALADYYRCPSYEPGGK